MILSGSSDTHIKMWTVDGCLAGTLGHSPSWNLYDPSQFTPASQEQLTLTSRTPRPANTINGWLTNGRGTEPKAAQRPSFVPPVKIPPVAPKKDESCSLREGHLLTRNTQHADDIIASITMKARQENRRAELEPSISHRLIVKELTDVPANPKTARAARKEQDTSGIRPLPTDRANTSHTNRHSDGHNGRPITHHSYNRHRS